MLEVMTTCTKKLALENLGSHAARAPPGIECYQEQGVQAFRHLGVSFPNNSDSSVHTSVFCPLKE